MQWKSKSVVFSLLMACSSLSIAHSQHVEKQQAVNAGTFESVMPDNNLHLRTSANAGNMTEARFNEIINQVVGIYEPIVRSHGGTLIAIRSWTNNTVNAQAYQIGSNWYIEMFGGLARAPEITDDGFALVACHEMGHHLGGFPFYQSGATWAASEGQADFFASQACARQLWDTSDNSQYAAIIPATPKAQCDLNWSDQFDRNLCYRVALAGKSLADLLAAGRGTTVSFDRKDQNKVAVTITSHPQAQCRLDTYVTAGLCNVPFDAYRIPGLNAPLGNASFYAEQEAAIYSCERISKILLGYIPNEAGRPRCWYKPSLTDGENPLPIQ